MRVYVCVDSGLPDFDKTRGDVFTSAIMKVVFCSAAPPMGHSFRDKTAYSVREEYFRGTKTSVLYIDSR